MHLRALRRCQSQKRAGAVASRSHSAISFKSWIRKVNDPHLSYQEFSERFFRTGCAQIVDLDSRRPRMFGCGVVVDTVVDDAFPVVSLPIPVLVEVGSEELV